MILSRTSQLTGVLAAVALAGLATAPVAQATPASKMTHGKKSVAHTVYVCKHCKTFYSPAMAKKMGYKDGMGHKLVKQAKAPSGYMDGNKMKM